MSSKKKSEKITRTSKRRKLKKMLIANLIFSVISLVSLGIFSYFLLDLNIIPIKYLGIVYGGIGIIYLILFIIFFKKKCPKPLKIIAYIFSAILSIIFIAGSIYLNTTNNFFKNTEIGEYDTITYSVIALKENKYEMKDLKNKTIGYLNDDNKKKVAKKLKNKVKYEEILENDANTLATKLKNREVEAICLEQGYIGMLSEEIENFEKTTEVIYTFDIKVKAHKEKSKIDASKEPFILYISGIDQYGSVTSVRGRSDVNQLAIVNPKNHKILLLNTPRDYYVQLSGTTGLKDKLTHAGIYGIDKSIATLEELYDIDINYYMRVNFDSLIKIVDTVGGIEVYSDTDLTLLHDKNYHVRVGMNKLNGKQALAYARERYGYASGDRHRGENQQAIIKAIIGKMTDSKILLSKYNDILKSLNGSFQTDMPSETLTKFLKKQLNEMPSWTIDNYAVDGSGGKKPTYSMGANRYLYVMIPNQDSVNTAKQKINAVLNEK